MTDADIDLMRLAAKAAGLSLQLALGGTADDRALYVQGENREWNPLEDDGDALRLAVKLRIDVLFDCLGVQSPTIEAIVNTDAEVQPFAIEALDTGDPYAATRRAIVRAAAEIGRAR